MDYKPTKLKKLILCSPPFVQRLHSAHQTRRKSLPGGLVAASLRQTVRCTLSSLDIIKSHSELSLLLI